MTLPNTADIAVIILTIHALIACVVPVVLFYFVARGAIALDRKTRQVMPTVQDYARQMSDGATKVSDRVAEPIVKAESTAIRLRAMWERSTGPLRRQAQDGQHRP